MSEDLKPCPFCGSPGRVAYMGLVANAWAVGCSSPGCFNLSCDFVTHQDAAEAWNRRSPLQAEGLRQALEAVRTWDSMYDALPHDLAMKVQAALTGGEGS